MVELSFIIIGIIIAVIAFKTIQKRAKAREPETDADAELTFHKSSPVYPKQNDKIVLIEGADHSDMKNVVTGFCNMYNEKNYKTLPRLLKLSERDFAIIFPYDIDFEIYCYFINYLNYPIEIKWDAKVTGWIPTISLSFKWPGLAKGIFDKTELPTKASVDFFINVLRELFIIKYFFLK